MKILGIETSADDTGVALIGASGEFGPDFRFKILANFVSSQPIHAHYGGIFPALAKREHANNLPVLLANVRKLYPDRPDAIAVTTGPGLEPCLWQGITAAEELARAWNTPIVSANHMEGHIVISMIAKDRLATFEFPVVALLISGGHTELILVKNFGSYEYIGRTRDDAVGEAFDKVARLLGLPYPGGPEISRLAESARKILEATPQGFHLPRPMMTSNDYDFSFSGLKTAVERYVQSNELQALDREKLAREFEDAVTDVLLFKTLRAVEEFGAYAALLGGGVSANAHIREVFSLKLESVGSKLLVCAPEYSTDNALMIAIAGYFHAAKNEFAGFHSLVANGSLRLA